MNPPGGYLYAAEEIAYLGECQLYRPIGPALTREQLEREWAACCADTRAVPESVLKHQPKLSS